MSADHFAESREWKPGDVALVRITRWPGAREWSDDTSAVYVRIADDGYMHVVDDDPAAPLCVPPRLIADYVRPLVPVDPESREQVERLALAYVRTWATGDPIDPKTLSICADQMQAALREFADPKSPRPEEPTGLGAVVEDASGHRWVRTHHELEAHWRRAGFEGLYRGWDDIDVVLKLSDGVES